MSAINFIGANQASQSSTIAEMKQIDVRQMASKEMAAPAAISREPESLLVSMQAPDIAQKIQAEAAKVQLKKMTF